MCESVGVGPMYGMCVMCLCSCMVCISIGIAKCEVLYQSPSLGLHRFVQTCREHRHIWVCPLCAVCAFICVSTFEPCPILLRTKSNCRIKSHSACSSPLSLNLVTRMHEIKLGFQGLFLRQASMSGECEVAGSSLNPGSLALLLAPSLPGVLSSRWPAQCYQGRVTSGVQGPLSVLGPRLKTVRDKETGKYQLLKSEVSKGLWSTGLCIV